MINPRDWAIIFGEDSGDQVEMILNRGLKVIISEECGHQAGKIPKRSVTLVPRNMSHASRGQKTLHLSRKGGH
jgi:hypothetical protein